MQIQAYEAMGEEDTATKQKLKDLAITEYPSQEQTDNTSYVHTGMIMWNTRILKYDYIKLTEREGIGFYETYRHQMTY